MFYIKHAPCSMQISWFNMSRLSISQILNLTISGVPLSMGLLLSPLTFLFKIFWCLYIVSYLETYIDIKLHGLSTNSSAKREIFVKYTYFMRRELLKFKCIPWISGLLLESCLANSVNFCVRFSKRMTNSHKNCKKRTADLGEKFISDHR